jgi:hypothetical protein
VPPGVIRTSHEVRDPTGANDAIPFAGSPTQVSIATDQDQTSLGIESIESVLQPDVSATTGAC